MPLLLQTRGWRLAAACPRGCRGPDGAVPWVPRGMGEPAAPWFFPQVEEQLYQLQHERADLLKRVDEDQEDLNELMAKHKALIAQVGAGAGEGGQRPPPWEGPWDPLPPGWGHTAVPLGAQQGGDPGTRML